MTDAEPALDALFPLCRAALDDAGWHAFCNLPTDAPADLQGDALAQRADALGLPAWLPELALVEWTRRQVEAADADLGETVEQAESNPTLHLLHADWRLTPLIEQEADPPPEPGEEWVGIWRHPTTGETRVEALGDEALLALKLVVEGISPVEAAAAGDLSAADIYRTIDAAGRRGLLLTPPSKIRRDTRDFPMDDDTPEGLVACRVFALQWHITHACDLHCKHCYDRSKRSPLTLEQAGAVLDDYRSFCDDRAVAGHVCLTGGNPLLHPDIYALWRAAADRGFSLSMLGNAAPRGQIERLIAIQRPTYYQVSLEGLREHNDAIRGEGTFDRVMEFLDVLRELQVEACVMLTLTRDNIEQVLPLAEHLRDRADYFTFNRLSPVGEGARLQLPGWERYESFLAEYVTASEDNPIMGFKDNLINVELAKRGEEPFDGCTGFGCGAAFNFICVLPDGEAHACRKFPSPIGNVHQDGIAGVYDSDAAKAYRAGSAACAGCTLRPNCGGCMAVTGGCGWDIHRDRDPFCLYAAAPGR